MLKKYDLLIDLALFAVTSLNLVFRMVKTVQEKSSSVRVKIDLMLKSTLIDNLIEWLMYENGKN